MTLKQIWWQEKKEGDRTPATHNYQLHNDLKVSDRSEGTSANFLGSDQI